MSEEKIIQRTCSQCGQLKPRSAFLYFNEEHSARYGLICDSCRSNPLNKQSTKQEDEAGRGKAELRIGAREIVQIKNTRQRQIEEKFKITEKEKETKLILKKEENTQQQKNSEEKKLLFSQLFIRPTIPEKKPFFGNQKQQTELQETKTEEINRTNEKKIAVDLHKKNKEKKEKKLTENTASLEAQQTHTISHDNEAIRNLFTLLGGSAPGANLILGTKAKTEKTGKKPPTVPNLFNQNAAEKLQKSAHKKNNTENPVEFINNRWGPKSRR